MSESGRFQRSLTRRVRTAVAESPQMLAEYRRRHRFRWLQMAVAFVFGVSANPIVCALAVAVVGWSVIDVLTVERVLIVHAGFMLVAVMLLPFLGSRLFCSHSGLARWAFQPISDKEIRTQSMQLRLTLVFFYALAVGGLHLYVCRLERLSEIDAIVVIGAGLLKVWFAVAVVTLARHFPAASPVKMLVGGGTLMLFVGYFLVLLAATGVMREQIFYPIGWIDGMIYYAVLHDQPLGWLFLIPVLAISLDAVWWLRRGYTILEIHFSSTGECTPIFSSGLKNQRQEKAKESPRAKESDEAIVKRLLSSPRLRPADWTSGGWIERWVGARMSDRERALVERLCGGRPCWTIQCVFLLLVLAACLSAWWVFQAELGVLLMPTLRTLVWVWPTFTCIIFNSRFPVSMQSSQPQPHLIGSFHPLFPCGLAEVAALRRRLLSGLIAVIAAIAVGMFAVSFVFSSVTCRQIATVFILFTPIVVVLHEVSSRTRFARHGTTFWTLRRMLPTYVLFPISVIAAGIAAMHPSPLYNLAASVVALVLVWISCEVFDQHYLTECNFQIPRPLGQAARP